MSKRKIGRTFDAWEPTPHVPGTEEPWMYAEIGHRGHGPKNYARSDERVREEVCEVLTCHDGIDARDIEVFVDKGDTTLVGTVTSRAMKHATIQATAACHGVKHVYDQLRVVSDVAINVSVKAYSHARR